MQTYDRSGKWLIQHHGDSILRLAGVEEITSWRALPAEVVQPRKLPDGLIEARLTGRPGPDLFVLELMTYPDEALVEQVVRDAMLVYLDRGTMPEVLALILHPKGRLRAASGVERLGPLGWSGVRVSWKVVELWTLPAERLLEVPDVGVVPWVTLCRIDGPPEPIFRRCRERIDREAPPDEHENLLAVAQVLAGLRYNDPRLFAFFGGEATMIESPVLQDFLEKHSRKAIHGATRKILLQFLVARFGEGARDLATPLEAIEDEAALEQLATVAATCPDLATFRSRVGA